jgi:hypothetical protein
MVSGMGLRMAVLGMALVPGHHMAHCRVRMMDPEVLVHLAPVRYHQAEWQNLAMQRPLTARWRG